MAVGTPVQSATALKLSQTGSMTFNPGGTIAAGTFCLIVVANGQSKTVSSVTDNAGGNTWTVDRNHTGNTKVISYISCRLATQITSSTVITVNFSASTSADAVYWLMTIPFIAASSPFDQSADQDITAGTAISVGPTGTLAIADEIVFCASRGGTTAGNTYTAGSGWTAAATFTQYTTSGGPSQLEYKIVASTAAVTATATWGVNQTGTSSVASYKGLIPYQKTGAIVSDADTSGADVYTAAQAGSIVSDANTSGADVYTAAQAGSVVSDANVSAADAFLPSKTGAIASDANTSGADVYVASQAGSVVSDADLSGSKALAHIYEKTGAIVSDANTSAASAAVYFRAGAIVISVTNTGWGTSPWGLSWGGGAGLSGTEIVVSATPIPTGPVSHNVGVIRYERIREDEEALMIALLELA